MKSTGWSFIEHEKHLVIEGFDLHKFLDRCLKKKIALKDIKIISEYEMEVTVKAHDMRILKSCAKQEYQISIKGQGGYLVLLQRIKSKKILIAGIALFLMLIYVQSLFMYELRIYGYEENTETEIREILAEKGFREGSLKLKTLEEVEDLELYLFQQLGNIVYAKIEYKGGLGIVTISESKDDESSMAKQEKKEAFDNNPCNIISDKEGYVYEIIPETGVRAKENGEFVKAGDVLISGIVPLQSTAYGTGREDVTEMYVRAGGTAKLKIPYRNIFYLSPYDILREPTGRWYYTVDIKFGNDNGDGNKIHIDTNNIMKKFGKTYDIAQSKEGILIDGNGKIPIRISWKKWEEVNLLAKKRDEKRLEELANFQIRKFIKENLPENSEITNKDLNFNQKENIIIVMYTLETIQKTGIEQEIKFDQIHN